MLTDYKNVWTEEENVDTIWSEMDLEELHDSGLLAQVNRAVFWPLGLALTIAGNSGLMRRNSVLRPTSPR